MDRMVNNNQLTWKLVWILKTYRTCNSTVRFSKYEFYKKLLGGVTLLEVTSGVTWTQPSNIERERERDWKWRKIVCREN